MLSAGLFIISLMCFIYQFSLTVCIRLMYLDPGTESPLSTAHRIFSASWQPIQLQLYASYCSLHYDYLPMWTIVFRPKCNMKWKQCEPDFVSSQWQLTAFQSPSQEFLPAPSAPLLSFSFSAAFQLCRIIDFCLLESKVLTKH